MNTAPALIHHWDFLLIMNPKDRTFDDNAGDSHIIKWLGQKQKKGDSSYCGLPHYQAADESR